MVLAYISNQQPSSFYVDRSGLENSLAVTDTFCKVEKKGSDQKPFYSVTSGVMDLYTDVDSAETSYHLFKESAALEMITQVSLFSSLQGKDYSVLEPSIRKCLDKSRDVLQEYKALERVLFSLEEKFFENDRSEFEVSQFYQQDLSPTSSIIFFRDGSIFAKISEESGKIQIYPYEISDFSEKAYSVSEFSRLCEESSFLKGYHLEQSSPVLSKLKYFDDADSRFVEVDLRLDGGIFEYRYDQDRSSVQRYDIKESGSSLLESLQIFMKHQNQISEDFSVSLWSSEYFQKLKEELSYKSSQGYHFFGVSDILSQEFLKVEQKFGVSLNQDIVLSSVEQISNGSEAIRGIDLTADVSGSFVYLGRVVPTVTDLTFLKPVSKNEQNPLEDKLENKNINQQSGDVKRSIFFASSYPKGSFRGFSEDFDRVCGERISDLVQNKFLELLNSKEKSLDVVNFSILYQKLSDLGYLKSQDASLYRQAYSTAQAFRQTHPKGISSEVVSGIPQKKNKSFER